MSISIASDNISMLSEGTEHQKPIAIDQTWYRLIPSRFPPVRVFERVIANDLHDDVTMLEAFTSPRVKARERIIGVGAVDETSPQLQNWNHAPFAYLNPEGSTLFRPSVAVLEVFDTLQTALAVSVKRRERFLSNTQMPKLGLDMRVLTTRVIGNFYDLRGTVFADDRDERWSAGDRVLQKHTDGVLFNCPEREGAACLAILNGGVLSRSLQADHFRFVWDGQRVSSLYSFSGPGAVINAADLAGPAIRELRQSRGQ